MHHQRSETKLKLEKIEKCLRFLMAFLQSQDESFTFIFRPMMSVIQLTFLLQKYNKQYNSVL